ncbi:ABC transporter ATP-binding protein [Nonomuraea sp. CA-143628]|uniref:ABC transporter ATP-binding protein n=1 Tax=Nonomuraea sp. CA-143628 TaxID=3239997 RepID=UPI003D8AAFF7
MPEPVIELSGVCRDFPADPPVRALAEVNLRVDPGDYLAIVGPSGSGKSTLLNVLGLLDRPTSGSYRLDGVETTMLRDGARTRLRGTRIGFVFQSFHLLPHRSVVENVMLAEVYGPHPRSGRRTRAVQALEQVSLGHRIGFAPDRLSGGERQRVAIARALMAKPALLLCDEPTGNLDSRNTGAILDLFDGLRADGLTILVITHEDEVSARAERRVHITDGVLREAP